jgi:hypothetical protein
VLVRDALNWKPATTGERVELLLIFADVCVIYGENIVFGIVDCAAGVAAV